MKNRQLITAKPRTAGTNEPESLEVDEDTPCASVLLAVYAYEGTKQPMGLRAICMGRDQNKQKREL